MGRKRKTATINATNAMADNIRKVDYVEGTAGKKVNYSPVSRTNASQRANKYAPGKSKVGKVSQGGDISGISAGHARVRKGKNSTGAGRPQAFRG